MQVLFLLIITGTCFEEEIPICIEYQQDDAGLRHS